MVLLILLTVKELKQFNYSIKKYLSKEFISHKSSKLDFQFKIINYYNNKIHRILGMSPNDAYKITDKDKIKEIKKKKINYLIKLILKEHI